MPLFTYARLRSASACAPEDASPHPERGETRRMAARKSTASDLRASLGPLTRELPAVASYIRQGRCALFVGAGLSAAAGYPLWPALIDALIKRTVAELGTVERPRMPRRKGGVLMVPHWITNQLWEYRSEREQIAGTAKQLRRLARAQRLLDVADQCRALLGAGRFASLLRELLPQAAKPTSAHRSIVETPYACVLTTNFDTLIEDAYALWGRQGRPKTPTGIELADHGTLLLDRTFFVLKAHGTLEDSASLVFTSDDYRRISFATPAFQAMLSAIFLSYAVLFVGYSLGDPNFRLLFDAQLTTFGTEVPPRYAIMSGVTEVERQLLWRTARIRTVEYPERRHELVPQILAYLAEQSAPADVSPAPSAKVRASARPKVSPGAGAPRRPLAPGRLANALYVRIAGRGIRLDVAWTDRASHARAWRDSDAGQETTIGPALLLPFSELYERLLTAAWSGRSTVTYVGGLLAAVLPAPLISRISSLSPGQPVVLALSAESEPLPWEWMAIDGAPLAERNPVVRAPVSVSDWSRGRAYVTEPLQALIIGDPGSGHAPSDRLPPDIRTDIMPLPGSGREATQVASLLGRIPGARVRLLVGADATYQTVMREVQTGDYDVIHFAGHAWFDERESYLALHDGRLWVSELGAVLHRRPPALMMINSHYTAFVPLFSRIQIPGEAPPKTVHDHLARAVARARGFTRLASRTGVAEFIACFGEPGDDAAAQFAIDTYAALAAGRTTVAEAVLRARRAVVDDQDITRLLFTHSGFGDTVLHPGG